MENCYSRGEVTGEDYVGGLVGWNVEAAVIENCYATGSVTGTRRGAGGLVGYNSDGSVSYSYSTGAVAGVNDVGGLIGGGYDGEASSCFWDVNSSGQGSSDGGTGKTTAEMQTESTFTSAGWDFVGEVINGPNDIWDICEGTNYPKLVWSISKADFVCPDGVDGIDLGLLCEEWLLEELSVDLWPQGGDGFVNFLDWAIFADGWGVTVDYDDLADFAEQWLKSGSNYLITDIAPGSDGDGITNGVDFAALADNWLAGI
ncbi:MAG: GLUG motif-containing protein [Planctomycetota bacterium]